MSEGNRYLTQAVTFHNGTIQRVLKEEATRHIFAAKQAAECMKGDLTLRESGASIYIDDVLHWSNPLSPGAPLDLRQACRTL